MNGLTERYNLDSLWRLYKILIYTHQICVTKQFIGLPKLLRIGNIDKVLKDIHHMIIIRKFMIITLNLMQHKTPWYDIKYSKGKSLFTNQVLIRF